MLQDFENLFSIKCTVQVSSLQNIGMVSLLTQRTLIHQVTPVFICSQLYFRWSSWDNI